MAKKKVKSKSRIIDREERRKKKRELEVKVESWRGTCAYWGRIVPEQHPTTLAHIEKELASLEEKKAKLAYELAIAPSKLAEAQSRLKRAMRLRVTDVSEPKIKRLQNMAQELVRLQKEIEESELTPEQIDLIKQYNAGPSSVEL